MTDDPFAIASTPVIDISVPHSARIWNFWLGGKDNYPIDREIGEAVAEVYPDIVEAARASRHFLGRSIRFLAGEAGIDQFLDAGTGLPTVDNTHEIAQRVTPHAQIVYVDNDPLVLLHARALLTSSPEGTTDYVDADLRDPDRILAAAAKTLDFTRPIALILNGVMGHVADDEQAHAIVTTLMDALPSGSYLSLSDGTDGGRRPGHAESMRLYKNSGAVPYHLRTPERFARFFEGLELVEPGVVTYNQWRLEVSLGPPKEIDGYCGVARKS